MKKMLAFLLVGMVLGLCACTGTSAPAQSGDSDTAGADASGADAAQVQYEYQLKAGEPMEVYDGTFDQMVTVTVDPDSTRDGAVDLRSEIYFDNCTFNAGLTIAGDYHAMVSFGGGCAFGNGSVVTCKEASSGVAQEISLEDNIIKVFVACEGVTVETESAIGILSDGPDFVFNGTTYSKQELAPDAAFLGVYDIYENGAMTYIKLAIGEDDSAAFLD